MAFQYGKTYVVQPKGRHQATIVWLHGLGDDGESWSQLLETVPLPNIKWICPTAPTRPMTIFGGFPSTAWFDVGHLSEDGDDDIEGMDASAAHVANLLSAEPADGRFRTALFMDIVMFRPLNPHSSILHDNERQYIWLLKRVTMKLGVGGFSMGAATALYSASCFVLGKYGNGSPYPVKLSAVVGLSGWLPCSKFGCYLLLVLAEDLSSLGLSGMIAGVSDAAGRILSLPILLCHGKGDLLSIADDAVVQYKWGEKSSISLSSNGFQDLTFKSYDGLGHYTNPEEMDELCSWLTSKLGLDGRPS
ncbi:Phospholipase/carboxylesterase/thioesterase [Dillenia turbinata]|uniref:Phospholipase/carboxylesterase/thioesterase n=1 Tax=Dillenia turbinata TaxID=194707 RepID=A0AAN8W4N2_9MAGN